MLLKTILNRVAPQKSFVYRQVTFVSKKGRVALEIDIEARRNSQAICSGCHRKRGMTDCPHDGSSSYRCGRLLCSSSIPCVALIARSAE